MCVCVKYVLVEGKNEEKEEEEEKDVEEGEQ